MQKILVTGACGYIGARLSKYLAEKRYRVTAFDSYDPSKYSWWISVMDNVIVGDIRDQVTLSNLAEKQFNIVIHLISLDHHRSEGNPNFVSSINVMPTWNLLKECTGKNLERFVYFSTQQVLGKTSKKTINENSKPKPVNQYGLTHLLSEKIVNFYNNTTDTKCINVRISNGYGSPVFKENNCWWLVVNDMCMTAFKEKKINLFSDGSPQRDFIHIKDIMRAICLLIDVPKEKLEGNLFNISSGKTNTILELAGMVKKIYKKRYNIDISVYFPNNTITDNFSKYCDIDRYCFDNSKIKQIGFQPEINLYKGINEIFDFLENSY